MASAHACKSLILRSTEQMACFGVQKPFFSSLLGIFPYYLWYRAARSGFVSLFLFGSAPPRVRPLSGHSPEGAFSALPKLSLPKTPSSLKTETLMVS